MLLKNNAFMEFLLTKINDIINNIEYYVERRDKIELENNFILDEILNVQKIKNSNRYAFYLSQNNKNIFIVQIANNFKVRLLTMKLTNNFAINNNDITSIKNIEEITIYPNLSSFELLIILMRIRIILKKYESC